ncbi:MAG: MOSC domain-containing protein [Turicibacter sp.]|nr:MOSC domain-containing protein [Turicibacter sp.]
MAVVKAICISKRKGTQKTYVEEAKFIADHGIEQDAHAGNWHRQVSLLAYETIADFNARGADVHDGAFGENLIVEGLDLVNLPVGTRLKCQDVELEITQIGKDCHVRCHIFHKMGDCIMPTNGVFAKVVKGGIVRVGGVMICDV